MAEAMFRWRALLSGAPLSVQSAGFATEGVSPPEPTIAAMRRMGIDVSAHRSQLVTEGMLLRSDLVVGMTRSHVWEAALIHPEIVPHAFVIGELARLNEEIGGRVVGEPLEHWLERLHDRRNQGRRGPRAGDEIPDPYGRRKGVHRKVALRLEEIVFQLGDCAFEPLYEFSRSRWCEGRLIWHPGMDGPAAPGTIIDS
jgi:protein-tyrosine-phosphatase